MAGIYRDCSTSGINKQSSVVATSRRRRCRWPRAAWRSWSAGHGDAAAAVAERAGSAATSAGTRRSVLCRLAIARPVNQTSNERINERIGQPANQSANKSMVYYQVTLCGTWCSCVRLSQVGLVSKRLDESSWVLAQRLPSTYPTLRYKEICVSTKIRVPASGTLPQTWT